MVPTYAACNKPWYGSAYVLYHLSDSHFSRRSFLFTPSALSSLKHRSALCFGCQITSPLSIPKMAPTTRSQIRRKSLRSYVGWEMFTPMVLKSVLSARHGIYGSPRQSRQKLLQTGKTKRKIPRRRVSKRPGPTPSLIINNVLPDEVLRIILLNLDERTLLLQCQRVRKTWAEIISGLPLDLTNFHCYEHAIW